MDERELDARETTRLRRRDRRMGAADRALLRTGTAKVFHQILQRQAKDARALRDVPRAGRTAGPEASANQPADEPVERP